MDESLYDVLGVSPDAILSDIKKAFRKLSLECHPDIFPDDPEKEEQFKKINNAYEILKDKEKRARYDAGEEVDQKEFDPKATVAQLFMNLIESIGDNQLDLINMGDPMKIMIDNTKSSQKNIKATIAKCKNKIKKLKMVKKRIKGKDDFFQNIISKALEGLEGLIEKKEVEIEQGDIIIEFIKNYSWKDFDPSDFGEEFTGYLGERIASTRTLGTYLP